MNAVTVLHYGHAFLLASIENVPQDQWLTGGVCGCWSVKDIIAHLASIEHALIDIFKSLDGDTNTPVLQEFMELGLGFNDALVDRSQGKSSDVIWDDYMAAYEESLDLARKCPAEKFNQNGILPWYGEEYDLDDFIVYTFYGHKREHGGQIAIFRDTLT